MHAVGPYTGGDGPDAPDFSALRNPPAQGFSFPDEFNELARARYFYRKHDCARGFDRLPGDPAFHVHDRDRADAGHRRPEIHGRVEGIHHPCPAWRIGPDLCDWHRCRYRDELPHTGGVSFRVPDSVDSDYGGMGSAVCRDRRGWRAAGWELSRVARQPQGW